MENTYKCICGGSNYSFFKTGVWKIKGKTKSFQIAKCSNCHTLRTYPPPKLVIASGDTKEREGRRAHYTDFAKVIITKVKKYQNRKVLKLLDIGCNTGILVKEAEEVGWEAVGIDIDKKVVNYGRKRHKTDLRHTSLEEANFKPGSFSVVTLVHTLEHIKEPVKLLKKTREILKKDGVLIIEVPNYNSLPQKVQTMRGKIWYGFDPVHHVWHFDKNSLRLLLKRSGFKTTELDCSHPMYYEKSGGFTGITRRFILLVSQYFNWADQIILIARPK